MKLVRLIFDRPMMAIIVHPPNMLCSQPLKAAGCRFYFGVYLSEIALQ